MKFAKASGGTLPKDSVARSVSLSLAFWVVCMLVGQLFGFEDLPGALLAYAPILGEPGSLLAAVVLVVMELAVLPALLHMRLSRLARAVGWLAGAVALDMWLVLVVAALVGGAEIPSALFGTALAVPAGWWEVTLILLLDVLYLTAVYRSFFKNPR